MAWQFIDKHGIEHVVIRLLAISPTRKAYVLSLR